RRRRSSHGAPVRTRDSFLLVARALRCTTRMTRASIPTAIALRGGARLSSRWLGEPPEIIHHQTALLRGELLQLLPGGHAQTIVFSLKPGAQCRRQVHGVISGGDALPLLALVLLSPLEGPT